MVFLDNITPKSLFLLLHNGQSLFLLCDTKYFADYVLVLCGLLQGCCTNKLLLSQNECLVCGKHVFPTKISSESNPQNT